MKSIEQVKTSAVVSPNKSVLKSSDESEGTRVKSSNNWNGLFIA